MLLNLKESIRKYDYLLDAGDYSIRYIKISNNRNYVYIVKLSINSRTKGNSVISGIVIDNKKMHKYIKNIK